MSLHESSDAHIYISSDIHSTYENFKQRFHPLRVVGFVRDVFKLEDAKAVVAESYISESQTKYIIFGGVSFTNEAQNSLLKVLEEPPKNIKFIILSPTKSNLLPTVRSRLPIVTGKVTHAFESVDINLARIDYNEVFNFLKSNTRVSKEEAKLLVEALYKRATQEQKLILSASQLDNFDTAYRLLNLNSRPQSVLALILMGFVHAD